MKARKAEDRRKAKRQPEGDITERKKAEEELKTSEQKFKDLTEVTTDWVWEVDTDGVYIYSNPKIEDLLGYKASEVLGKTPFDFMPGEETERVRKIFKDCVINRKAFHKLENINRHKNGHLVVLETNGIPIIDEKGRLTGYRGIDRDITERKKAEEALHKSNELSQALLSTIPFGMDIVDEKGNILFMSERSKAMFSEEDIANKKCWELYRDDRKQCRDCPLIKGIKLGETAAVVVKDVFGGKIFHISHTGMLYEGRKAILEIFQDVTERKKAEEELQKSRGELERKVEERTEELKNIHEKLVRSERLAAIGQLAGAVSHELRNPLGVIRNSVYFLKMKLGKAAKKDDKIKRHMEILEEEVEVTNKVIDDILTFSRLKEKKMRFAKTDINDIIKKCLETKSMPGNIQVDLELKSDLPELLADEMQLGQVFSNVILNAIQAMPDGGQLSIINLKKGKFIETSFSDTGEGIPKDKLGKIFDPLFSTKTQGTGLGLAVCKSIVEIHEGSIEVKSEAGKGAKFIIKIPVASSNKRRR